VQRGAEGPGPASAFTTLARERQAAEEPTRKHYAQCGMLPVGRFFDEPLFTCFLVCTLCQIAGNMRHRQLVTMLLHQVEFGTLTHHRGPHSSVPRSLSWRCPGASAGAGEGAAVDPFIAAFEAEMAAFEARQGDSWHAQIPRPCDGALKGCMDTRTDGIRYSDFATLLAAMPPSLCELVSTAYVYCLPTHWVGVLRAYVGVLDVASMRPGSDSKTSLPDLETVVEPVDTPLCFGSPAMTGECCTDCLPACLRLLQRTVLCLWMFAACG
jgi:hypothetical protein